MSDLIYVTEKNVLHSLPIEADRSPTPWIKWTFYDIPHWLGKRTKHPFIRVWKPFPSRRLTGKPIRESLKMAISASSELGPLPISMPNRHETLVVRNINSSL